MRKNTEAALSAFLAGKSARPAASIWSNGRTIYSYRTPIAERENGRVYLNRTRYSRTTTIHQNALAAALPDAVEVHNVPMGRDSVPLSAYVPA